jgi:hypothetical protein
MRKVAGLLVSVALIAYFISRSFDPHAADFKSFYSAGYAVTHPGIPLYDLIALDENPFGEVFKLPPPAAVYLAPLSLGTIQEARLAWRIVLVAALFAAYVLLTRAFGVTTFSWPWLAGLAAWASFSPAQISVGEGQWDPLILLALAAAAAAIASGREIAAGVLVAVAATIKVYPAIVAVYFLARRRGAPLLAGALTGFALMALGVIVVGPNEAIAYLTRVLPASGVTTAYPDNQTIGGILARAMTDDFKPFPLVDAEGLDLAIRLIAVGLIAGCGWLIAASHSNDPLDRALQFALLVPVTILVLPAGWTHYQTILLLPLFLLALAMARRGHGWIAWLALGVAFWLTALPNPAMLIGADVDRALWLRSRADGANLVLDQMYPTALSKLILSYKAFGTMMVLGLMAWQVARQRVPNAAVAEGIAPRHGPGVPIAGKVLS